MTAPPIQLTLGDEDAGYQAFLDKFKPRKTTDDCYTPPRVYEVVRDYVARRFGRDRSAFVRPFWPGGDYRRAEYPPGCTVVDNPPFSIITPIVEWYASHGIPFFLFAPYLSNLGIARRRSDVTHLIAPVSVRYENGAEVPTAFVHNLALTSRPRPTRTCAPPSRRPTTPTAPPRAASCPPTPTPTQS